MSVSFEHLEESRLILVTGKGGTGKSTLASAIAGFSAARGKKTIVAEIDSFQTSLDRTLGVTPDFEPKRVRKDLYVCNITWKEALTDWLRSTISGERIVRMILKNRVVQLFLDATPGVRETVILSRIHALTREYDQVVVDMPASGHALSILRVPHIATSLLGGGPIRERSEEIIELLGDQYTALCIVGIPEEMVVNETIELWEKLSEQNREISPPMVVLNRSAVPTTTAEEQDLLDNLSGLSDLSEQEQEVLLAGRIESRLESATELSMRRLVETIEGRVVSIPRLGAQGGLPAGPLRITEQMQKTLERIRRRGSA